MTDPLPEGPADQAEEPAEAPRREPVLNLPRVVIVLIAICIAVHLVRVYVLDWRQDETLLLHAAFIPILYSGQFPLDIFSFTSPLSYSLLHGSVAHLAINMVWLAAFGSPLANRLGAPRFLFFWAAASVAAAALHYALHATSQAPLIGASGAISGMMGAAARFGFRFERQAGQPGFAGAILPIAEALRSRAVVSFLAVWMAINLVTGLFHLVPGEGSEIAWEAHIGGFVVGFFFIGRFDRKPGRG